MALHFLHLGARRGWLVNFTPRSLYPQKTDLLSNVQEAWWIPGPECASADNFTPTWIRSQDQLARSESLYRLSYPGPRINYINASTYMSHLLKQQFPSGTDECSAVVSSQYQLQKP
jgi:hypothetical protein